MMNMTRRDFLAGLAGGATLAILGGGCNQYAWDVSKAEIANRDKTLKSYGKPDTARWSNDDLTVTWIGHSTVLINYCGATILTDPILTQRIAPPEIFGVNCGLPRHAELPVKFEGLPAIDLVLLSHAHFDHWDMCTLRRFSPPTAAIVPRNDADLLGSCKFAGIRELDWGRSAKAGDLTVTAVHVEHWGARWGVQARDRGYNGYIIEGRGRKVFFGGDTAFQSRATGDQVDWRQRIGAEGFDLCILPIGAYYYHMNHATPEEAWSIHTQIKGRYFLPIHWGTFVLTPDPLGEAIVRLRAAAGPRADTIVCDQPGKVFVLKGANPAILPQSPISIFG